MASLLFKSQLQEYAQKSSISAPVYEIVKDGQPHAPNFKASVIVNGVRYESPDCFRNRKIAEHAAAQVALQELHKAANGGEVITTSAVYETGLCKNLLQEYAQKMSLPVPSYKYLKEGMGHDFSYTSTVEIAGICYQGGPAKSKKAAEIKAARTALTAIQAQQGFQGNLASPITTHVDVFDRSWSSQPEFHAGMKRDRAAEQPSTSGRRKGKNKKYKGSRWKKEVIQDPTNGEKILGENFMNGTENGQETASAQNTTVINIDDQHKNPEEEMSMDEGADIKQEQGPCLVDIKQENGLCSTDSQEQLVVEFSALVDANPATNEENIMGENSTNGQETASAQNTTVINIDDQHKNPEEEMPMDKGVDIKQEQGPCLVDIKQEHGLCSTDSQEQLVAEVSALMDANPATNEEKMVGENSTNEQETVSAQNTTVINIDVQHKNPEEEMSMAEGADIKQEQGPCLVDIKQEHGLCSTDCQEQLLAEVSALVDANPANQVAVDSQGENEESNQEENVIECNNMVVDSQGNYQNDKQKKNESQGGDTVAVPQTVNEQGEQVTTEDTDKCSVEEGENNHGTTQLVLMDPLPMEKEITQQELLDPLKYQENCN